MYPQLEKNAVPCERQHRNETERHVASVTKCNTSQEPTNHSVAASAVALTHHGCNNKLDRHVELLAFDQTAGHGESDPRRGKPHNAQQHPNDALGLTTHNAATPHASKQVKIVR